MGGFGRTVGALVKQRYMLSVMCGRSTYKLTWEEIVMLYPLMLDQPPVNTLCALQRVSDHYHRYDCGHHGNRHPRPNAVGSRPVMVVEVA